MVLLYQTKCKSCGEKCMGYSPADRYLCEICHTLGTTKGDYLTPTEIDEAVLEDKQ
jgi:hypothetical protein